MKTHAIFPAHKNDPPQQADTFIKRIKAWLRIKYIKCFHWEYWPMWLVYMPLAFYYIYLSIRARSFFFFSAANPSIETGGMFFESKWDVFKLIPSRYYPVTLLIRDNENTQEVMLKMNEAQLVFPVVAKPDRGERGWCVEILKNVGDLELYIASHPITFLLQEFIAYPTEMSIFYYRHPAVETGNITSVTLKEYLKVTGDGISSLRSLIKMNDRAFLQLKKLEKLPAINLDKILPHGQSEILVPFGNHVRGATFLDYNHIVDEQFTNLIDHISKQITGFYFGRFDIKCASINELKKGNFSILELNGSGAEPAHIYQPGFSFFKGQAAIMWHFKMMCEAAKYNHTVGVPYMNLNDYIKAKAAEKKYKQKVIIG